MYFWLLDAFVGTVGTMSTKDLLNFFAIIFLLITLDLLIVKRLGKQSFWILDLPNMTLSIFQMFLISFSLFLSLL